MYCQREDFRVKLGMLLVVVPLPDDEPPHGQPVKRPSCSCMHKHLNTTTHNDQQM